MFVLVGGWPGSGKTTLARPLASELGLAYLSKDELGVGPLIEVDTTGPVDVAGLAGTIRSLAG